MRRWIQIGFALLQNGYLAFPWTRNLYQGPLKHLCTPGLNCHSCPAAVLSCPLGILQHFLAAVRPAIRWGTHRFGFYVVGFLIAVGLVGGRFSCGWLCPFGLLQEWLYRIRSPKVALWRHVGALRYAVAAVFVVILPLFVVNRMGYGEPWFCRVVCPAGTLEASGLFFLMPELREQIGLVFALKIGLLATALGWAVVSYRPYCRALCPLGAIYGLFNRWSLLAVDYDPSLCRDCGSCVEGCEVELDPRHGSRSPVCLRCLGCATHHCPTGALSVRIGSARIAGAPCDPRSTPAS